MSRLLKFRAWVCGGMSHLGFHISCQGNVWQWTDTTYTNSVPLDAPVMQWTGLLDKNGVEIYEGDVLRVESFRTYIVRFLDGLFCADLIDGQAPAIVADDCYKIKFLCANEGCEVIGNIYANPELIPS